MQTTTFENNMLDLVTGAIMLPLQAIIGALWLIWAALALLACCWKPTALTAGIVGAVGLCVACPALPLGLAIVGVFAWVTMPRGK